MISVEDYFMGRDRTHGLQLGPDLRANAARTVEAVNKIMVLSKLAGVALHNDPDTGTPVSSGWRPADINARTKNAAKNSLHLTCEACDVHDPHGELGRWLQTPGGRKALEDLGLWMEEPSYTATWAHLQTRPPPSGRRYFIPR